MRARAGFAGAWRGMAASIWARTSRAGAVAGMLGGLGVTVYYMLVNAPALRTWAGLPEGGGLWFAIQPISAGVFGVPAGFALAAAVSLMRRRR